jgi:membrane protease YdiL (CAAX protease family)
MPNSASDYLRITRAPRYSLTFAIPLLLLYEVLAFSLSGHDFAGVRNGADVLLKSIFIAFGGRTGLILFGALLVGAGGWLVARDWRGRHVNAGVFAVMGLESILYALVFGLVASTLTTVLLLGLAFPARSSALALNSGAQWGFLTQLMISLGAGIYEELLFRVLLVSGLAWLIGWTLHVRRTVAAVCAVVTGALIFSAFHYIGPYGDHLTLASFTFRAVAGVLFSGLYLLRGFGIAAWTHALYDVFLAL